MGVREDGVTGRGITLGGAADDRGSVPVEGGGLDFGFCVAFVVESPGSADRAPLFAGSASGAPGIGTFFWVTSVLPSITRAPHRSARGSGAPADHDRLALRPEVDRHGLGCL